MWEGRGRRAHQCTNRFLVSVVVFIWCRPRRSAQSKGVLSIRSSCSAATRNSLGALMLRHAHAKEHAVSNHPSLRTGEHEEEENREGRGKGGGGPAATSDLLSFDMKSAHMGWLRAQESLASRIAGATRHKGRIERLRVQLAYGFEARTQHQLSSSWQRGVGGGAKLARQSKGDYCLCCIIGNQAVWTSTSVCIIQQSTLRISNGVVSRRAHQRRAR